MKITTGQVVGIDATARVFEEHEGDFATLSFLDYNDGFMPIATIKMSNRELLSLAARLLRYLDDRD